MTPPAAHAAGLDAVLLGAVMDPVLVAHPVRDAGGATVDFRCVDANLPAAEFLGLSQQDLVGARLLELFPEHERSGLLAILAGVVDSGASWTPDGFRYADARVDGFFDVRAVALGSALLVTWRDISEWRDAEEQLRLQARLLDEADAAVIATDLDGRITFWSAHAERLFGWSAAEAVGRTTFELLTPALSADELASLRATVLTGPHEGEQVVTRKDGTSVTVMTRLATIDDEHGEPVGLVGVSVDVTEQRAAEEGVRAMSQLLTSVTESMDEGVFALDEAGRVTYVNAAAEDILGWARTELLGQRMHDLTHFLREDGSPFAAADCPMTHVSSEGDAVRVERDVFVRRDGQRVPVAYSAAPLRGSSAGGCVVVFSDVSERLAEEQRRRADHEKVAWVGRVEDALREDRLVLYAQPIVRAGDRSVVQHELLLRMRLGPEIVLPGHFLPAAEEYGLIDQIDRWVAARAIELAARGLPVEFNVSARSVGDPRMHHRLADAIGDAAAGVPERLVCEITETTLMRDETLGAHFVHMLRELGCGVALDDFGAGYGGFSYLKRLPLTHLKIDRQFVVDALDDAASRHVIAATVNVASAFELITVAEGVESLAVVDLLEELGVDLVQGYATGRPAPVEEVFANAPTTAR